MSPAEVAQERAASLARRGHRSPAEAPVRLKELARRCGRSPRTLLNDIQAGRLVAARISDRGSPWVVEPREAERFVRMVGR